MKKIAFTGGPGSGKSTVIAAFKQEYGSKIQVVPEVATMLIKGGFPHPNTETKRIALQTAIVQTQRQLEAALLEESELKKALALFVDRAILDGAVYWPKGRLDFMKRFDVSEKDIKSYDAIIILRINRNAYSTANNHARTESLEEALKLEQRIIDLYKEFSQTIVIPPRNTIWATASKVASILGLE